MAWIVRVEKRLDDLGEQYARLTFRDGETRFRCDWHVLDPTPQLMADFAARIIENFETQASFWAAITDGRFDPAVKPDPPPDPISIAEQNYKVGLANLRRLRELVDLKVITENDVEFRAAENEVKVLKIALEQAISAVLK